MSVFRSINDMREDIGAAVVKAWKQFAGGWRLKHPAREAGPIKEAPSVQEDDIRFIGNASMLSKWADVQYYGPGAAEAEARRAERLGLMSASTEEKKTTKELKAEKKALKREAAALREQLKKLRGE